MKKNLIQLKYWLPAVLAAMIALDRPAAAQSVWNASVGVSANTNWSNAANWTPNGVPGASSNALFIDTVTTAPGTIDNVVNTSLTVQQLAYHQTNGVHNTLILPGVTLTVSNTAPGTSLLAGTESTASATTLMVTNTISGAGGTLSVTSSSTNVGSVIIVRQITSGAAGSHIEVLDLSGLDNFNATISNLWVGGDPGSATTRPQGMLFLAKTNNLVVWAAGAKSAPSIDLGDTGGSPDVNNTLLLGITNNVAADTIEVGNQRSGGILKFNPNFTSSGTPSLYLRGNSNARVASFNIGDNSSAAASIGSVTTGVVDFSGGTVDALVGSVTLGDGQPITGTGAGTATGTLTMTAGKFNVNTLNVAYQNNTGAAAANTGTVNVNGGTLTVNSNLVLAYYGGAGGLSKGTLNITNGTVLANNIVAGGGTSTLNMSGGILNITNSLGTVATPLSALSLSSGALLQLPVPSGATPVVVTSLAGDNTGVISISSLPAITGYPSAALPLIAYQNGSGSGLIFALGTLPGTFSGYISNDNTSTIWLVVTNGPSLASVVWGGGVNNLWDTTTLNWTNNGNAVKYHDLDVVTFNDTAKTGNVTVTGPFAPSGWAQNNNTLNYIFSGIGSINGPAGLMMNGSASVTLAETGGDSFSGGMLVNAGTVVLDDANATISGGLTIASGATVQIGNNDANGTLPAGGLDDEGTLIFDRTDSVVLTTGIPGAGALVQNGSGTLTLSAANTYSGNTTVSAGTLVLTNSGSLSSSAQIVVSHAKLDVSGLVGTIVLNNLGLTNSVLAVSIPNPQTPVSVANLSLGGTGNTINVSALPSLASYPTTLTLVQSASAISGFNLSAGTLPAGSAGSVALSGDGTAVLLTLTSGPVGLRPNVTWSGVDALDGLSTNWSDNQNWELPGAPLAVDNVVFNNTATAVNGSDLSSPGGGASALMPENIDNFVDKNFTVSTLTYTNNGGSYHNTAITNGATLNVTTALTIGGLDGVSSGQQEFVNFAGAGATLNVTGTNDSVQVWYGDSGAAATQATLDLSALDNFTAIISRLTIGACAVNNAVNRPSGILYLARTNTISCNYQTTATETGSTTGDLGLIVGDCNQNAGPESYLYLGQVNTISADTIAIARQKTTAGLLFNPIYANVAPYPSVILKGFTSALISDFDVGTGVGNTGTTSGTGDANLTGGWVTATVDTLNVGRASSGTSGSGTTTGTLEFDAGSITVNTANVGLQPVIGSKNGVGTISVNTNTTIGASAVLVVNGTLNLGVNVSSSSTAGTLNINGGTVQANTIVAGVNGAQSTIDLNAGTLFITGTAGSTAAPLTTLNLSDATTLELDVNGGADVTNLVATSVTSAGTTTLQIGLLAAVTTGVTYPLISYTGADPYSGLSLALPAGYTGSLVDNSGSGIIGLVLTTVPVVRSAHLTGIGVSGPTLSLSATNGVPGGRWVLLETTNLTKPVSQWLPILTNNFDANGDLAISTNILNPAVPIQFYLLSQ